MSNIGWNIFSILPYGLPHLEMVKQMQSEECSQFCTQKYMLLEKPFVFNCFQLRTKGILLECVGWGVLEKWGASQGRLPPLMASRNSTI